MKIRKLNIGSYRHLENIDLDFTYPEGHVKAGEPLEKICFIGQSATGKTGLLELVKWLVGELRKLEVVDGNGLWARPERIFKGLVEYSFGKTRLIIGDDGAKWGEREFPNSRSSGGMVSLLVNEAIKLIYFSSDIISDKAIKIFNQNPINILSLLSEAKKHIFDRHSMLNEDSYFYEFTQDVDEDMWFSLLERILEYRKKFTQMASELISKGAIGDLGKLNHEYQKWSVGNPNPLVSFADLFNPILDKLNLEVDLINTEYFIPIKPKHSDKILQISELSTGTKGLLLSFFPLFEYNTDDAIILIDEPERSLFPDMQIDLFSYYQAFAPNAQFITATHSPFIAAAFEPEERFILYYDDNGKVKVRRGTSPIGDDPNDILRNDFKVDYYNEFGKKAYQDYLQLKGQMISEKDPDKKKEILVELTKLGNKYNF